VRKTRSAEKADSSARSCISGRPNLAKVFRDACVALVVVERRRHPVCLDLIARNPQADWRRHGASLCEKRDGPGRPPAQTRAHAAAELRQGVRRLSACGFRVIKNMQGRVLCFPRLPQKAVVAERRRLFARNDGRATTFVCTDRLHRRVDVGADGRFARSENRRLRRALSLKVGLFAARPRRPQPARVRSGSREAPLKAVVAKLRRLYARIGSTVALMFAQMVVWREANMVASR
jgi:hypothetical protein